MKIFLGDPGGNVRSATRSRVSSSLLVFFNNVFFFGLVGPALVKAGAKTFGPDVPPNAADTALKSLPADARHLPTVTWTNQAPQPAQQDLLVYFVRDRTDSIVWLINKSPPAPDAAGITRFGPKVVGSEVYLRAPSGATTVDVAPDELAGMAFHECIHNVTGFDDARLHPMKVHKGHPTCFTAAVVPEQSFPCPGDVFLVADHLFSTARRSQWTAGFLAYNDPLRQTPP